MKKEQYGFRVLCGPYTKSEEWMLDNAIRHLEDGNIQHRIVETPRGKDLLRTTNGWKEDRK